MLFRGADGMKMPAAALVAVNAPGASLILNEGKDGRSRSLVVVKSQKAVLLKEGPAFNDWALRLDANPPKRQCARQRRQNLLDEMLYIHLARSAL